MRKLHLTPEIVDRIQLISRKEEWVGDLKIKGFGIRLWSLPDGTISKSYALRAKNSKGVFVRRTYNPYSSQSHGWRSNRWKKLLESNFEGSWYSMSDLTPYDFTMGEILEVARDWAIDEIAKMEGRPTLEQELYSHEENVRKRLSGYSLSDISRIIRLIMKLDGVKQPYLDRLDFLLFNNIPEEMLNKKLVLINIGEITKQLQNVSKYSNFTLLRQFIARIFDFPREHGVSPRASRREIGNIEFIKYSGRSKLLNLSDFKEIFSWLENSTTNRQQSWCIRFYFEANMPLNRVMAGKWSEIRKIDFTYRSSGNYAFSRWMWECYEDNRLGLELRQNHHRILKTIQSNREFSSKESDFWFPSKIARNSGHIRSVQSAWHACLNNFNISYLSPAEARRILKELLRSNPILFRSVLGNQDEGSHGYWPIIEDW